MILNLFTFARKMYNSFKLKLLLDLQSLTINGKNKKFGTRSPHDNRKAALIEWVEMNYELIV